MNNTKALFKSKTAVFNFILVLAGFFAYINVSATTFVQDHAPLILGIIGLAGIGLRRITKGAVVLFPLLVLCFLFVSCAEPTSYKADLSSYAPAIEENPKEVILKPEHVEPIGGGFPDVNFSGAIVTDHGSVSTNGKGVDIVINPIVIDTKSSK